MMRAVLGLVGPPKSDAGSRTIPIPPGLVAELKQWKWRCKPSKLGLAFPSSTGTPMRHNNLLRRMYIRLQVKAGLGVPKLDTVGKPLMDDEDEPILTGKYGFHALRHMAAPLWIESRIDLKRLQTDGAWLCGQPVWIDFLLIFGVILRISPAQDGLPHNALRNVLLRKMPS